VDACCHAEPWTRRYGVIAAAVQPPPLLTVNWTAVLAVKAPEVPVIVTVDIPVAAALLALNVRRLDAAAGFVANEAVTPLGRPEAARLTFPAKPPKSATVMVSVPLLPGDTVSAEAVGDRVKLGDPELTVMTKA
jgi:hypothetical protein